MPSNPEHHHRRTLRLKAYDYAQNGGYFVTICACDRASLFGEIVDHEMRLNDYGKIVEEEWLRTAVLRPYAELDAYVIMPNHFHGIVAILQDSVGARRALPLPSQVLPRQFGKPPAHSLSSIIGSFKSAVSRRVNLVRGTPGLPVWQRNYHEHIIRTPRQLERLREYIAANPARWAEDRYYAEIR